VALKWRSSEPGDEGPDDSQHADHDEPHTQTREREDVEHGDNGTRRTRPRPCATRASTSFTSTGRAKPEEPLNIGGDEQPAHDQPEGDPDEE
jgi:hypothetical protein